MKFEKLKPGMVVYDVGRGGLGAKVENLGDVKWLATEDGSQGKGTGRHIACFVLEPHNV